MSKFTKTAFSNARDRIEALPDDRRERIKALAREMASDMDATGNTGTDQDSKTDS